MVTATRGATRSRNWVGGLIDPALAAQQSELDVVELGRQLSISLEVRDCQTSNEQVDGVVGDDH